MNGEQVSPDGPVGSPAVRHGVVDVRDAERPPQGRFHRRLARPVGADERAVDVEKKSAHGEMVVPHAPSGDTLPVAPQPLSRGILQWQ